VVLGLAVIVLGLVGFVSVRAERKRILHSISVTFLCYTNIGPQGLPTDYRLARFRITNSSRYALYCQHGVADVERAGNWIQETNSFLYIHNPPDIEPGKSIMVSVLAPSE
jgi:hypothetical protein